MRNGKEELQLPLERHRSRAQAAIQSSQAAVSRHPRLRQVSQTTPTGVSHIGHQSSDRSRWRSITRAAEKPVRSLESTAEQRSGLDPPVRTRFQTMLVAPQPWLSLTPATNRLC